MRKDPLKTYFDGQSSLEEEKQLIDSLSERESHPEYAYFNALKELKAKKSKPKKGRLITLSISLSSAAAVMIGVLLFSNYRQAQAEKLEAQFAYVETQKALLLISDKLNLSKQRIAPIGEFEKTKQELQKQN